MVCPVPQAGGAGQPPPTSVAALLFIILFLWVSEEWKNLFQHRAPQGLSQSWTCLLRAIVLGLYKARWEWEASIPAFWAVKLSRESCCLTFPCVAVGWGWVQTVLCSSVRLPLVVWLQHSHMCSFGNCSKYSDLQVQRAHKQQFPCPGTIQTLCTLSAALCTALNDVCSQNFQFS